MANFAEMQKFKGEIVHSAEWTAPKLDGKRIALIGTGASSIQILPRLIKDSKVNNNYESRFENEFSKIFYIQSH